MFGRDCDAASRREREVSSERHRKSQRHEARRQRLLTEEEALEHLRNNSPLPAGCVLPEGWTTNVVHVPVAPPLSGQARLEFIQREYQRLPLELRRDPKYTRSSSSYWDRKVEVEYNWRLSSFFPTGGNKSPPAEWLSSDDFLSPAHSVDYDDDNEDEDVDDDYDDDGPAELRRDVQAAAGRDAPQTPGTGGGGVAQHADRH